MEGGGRGRGGFGGGRGDYRGGGYRGGGGGAFRGGGYRGRGRGRGGGFDGDDSMDDGHHHHREGFAPYERGRGRGGGRGRGRGGGATLPASGPYTIQIAGYDPRTKQLELDMFLKEKCSAALDPGSIAPGPFSKNGYSLTLQQQPEATALLSLSGIRYRGAKLEISCLQASGGGGGGGGGGGFAGTASLGGQLPEHIKDKLQQALVPLYNAQQQMLLCDQLAQRLAASPDSASIRVEWTRLSFVNTIAHIIHDNCPQVQTVSLDNNAISTLQAFKNFATLLPSVRNLSLANNAIENSEELDAFQGLQVLCMCVCVYVYMYICICMCMYVCVFFWVCACLGVCVYIHRHRTARRTTCSMRVYRYIVTAQSACAHSGKVSALVHSLYMATIERSFQNV